MSSTVDSAGPPEGPPAGIQHWHGSCLVFGQEVFMAALLVLVSLALADVTPAAEAAEGVGGCAAAVDAQVALVDAGAHDGLGAEGLWALRLDAQAELASRHADGSLDEACVVAVRGLDMALRRRVDAVLEAAGAPSGWLSAEAGFDPGAIRSGDILISRGDKVSSAGIASIGLHDSHFSHNATVWIDGEGRPWTVEAYLEKGAIVQSLDDFLAHGVGRVVVMRHDDPELAAAAAEAAYRRVVEGPAIAYDHGLDADDAQTWFCSEIGTWSFRQVGGPEVPLFRMPLDHEARGRLFDDLGVSVPAMTAPSDLLFDPRFTPVAEWRDMGLLETMRRQEAVVGAALGWIDEGYVLTPRSTQKATVTMGLALRRSPLGGVVAHMVHPKGDPQFLLPSLTLQTVGLHLLERLDEELGPEPAPRWVMDRELERLRRQDAELAKTAPRRAVLHRLMTPAG